LKEGQFKKYGSVKNTKTEKFKEETKRA